MLPPAPHFHRNGILLTAGLAGLVVVATLPPFVSAVAADRIMAAFAFVCHQLPGRSLHVDGTSLAVCHRCFGAYAGFVVGSLAFLISHGGALPPFRPYHILVGAALPGFADWMGDIVGIWTNSPLSRTVTGMWFGILAGLLLASAVLLPAVASKRTA